MTGTASLSALLRPTSREVELDVVRALANVKADAAIQARYEELAAKRTEDRLTPDESAELQSLVRANTILSVLKAEAEKRLESFAG